MSSFLLFLRETAASPTGNCRWEAPCRISPLRREVRLGRRQGEGGRVQRAFLPGRPLPSAPRTLLCRLLPRFPCCPSGQPRPELGACSPPVPSLQPPPPPPLQLPSSSKRPSAAREGGGESPCPVCFSLPSPILSRPSGHHGPLNCPEATGVGWGGGSSDDARGAVSGPGRCSSPLSACSPAAIRFGTFGPRGSRQL